ncbi:23932_t:CDS:1, partial [Gigaspora rosea]
MPPNFIEINYTNKPNLSWNPRQIKEVVVQVPITQTQELMEL